MIECSFGPSGVPSFSLPNQARYWLSSLMIENGCQLSPPSSDRNRPCGEVPAYQTPGSFACAGVSQKVCLTERPSVPGGDSPNFGGCLTSVQVLPASVERCMVG